MVLKIIAILPNSVHLTLTPIIFQDSKLDVQTEHLVPFETYAACPDLNRINDKYEPHIDNEI